MPSLLAGALSKRNTGWPCPTTNMKKEKKGEKKRKNKRKKEEKEGNKQKIERK